MRQLPYDSVIFYEAMRTEASKKGAPFGAIMRQGRWRHEGTVLGYIDEGKPFEQNAAGIVLANASNRCSKYDK